MNSALVGVIGQHRLNGPAARRMSGQVRDRADPVAQRDQRDVLPARAEPGPEARAGTAAAAAGTAGWPWSATGDGAQHADPGAGFGGRVGGRLPGPGDPGEQRVAQAGGVLGDDLGAVVAVVGDAVAGQERRPAARPPRSPRASVVVVRTRLSRTSRAHFFECALPSSDDPGGVDDDVGGLDEPWSTAPASGSQLRLVGGRRGARTSRMTSCPSARNRSPRAVPRSPEAPAITIRMRPTLPDQRSDSTRRCTRPSWTHLDPARGSSAQARRLALRPRTGRPRGAS